jgi:hypothetical protein
MCRKSKDMLPRLAVSGTLRPAIEALLRDYMEG